MITVGYIHVKKSYWDELLKLKKYIASNVSKEGQISYVGLPYYETIFDDSDIPEDINDVPIEDRVAALHWGQKILSCKVYAYKDMLCVVNPLAILGNYVDTMVVFPSHEEKKDKAYEEFKKEQLALISEDSVTLQSDDSVVKEFVEACHKAAYNEQVKRQNKLCDDIINLITAVSREEAEA